MKSNQTYHPALVALHWLLAVMLLVALFMGTVILQHTPNSSPDKLFALKAHMSAGAVILALTLVRLVVRIKSRKPAPATTGSALLDRVGALTHWVLYALVIAMAGSGFAMAFQAHLPEIVFQGVGTLPENFDALAPRLAHGIIAKALIALIALHVAAALFHQFVKKDRLLRRMSWKRD